ncbi:hypothetical protein LMG6000_02809 [Achromobacter insolitus]|uniref:Glycosyltransferase subfamily 4-like N-terminal domain-containing protein n=1 Tax=Achromobacter insolitus TaxID=217204 RepID=A0A6S7F2A4_9BURK|nr:hypothetical protein LMG5997_00270 [Achromobacter insolitus]CAB3932700.1 hypothetical protein LMG6000_02809 [Achromobacter insolitus]
MEKGELKIALVTQYFWPESFSINDLVEALVAQGHTVEVFTGKPNYPDGKIFPGYQAEGASEEVFAGSVAVHRAPLRPRGAGGAANLARNYLSFVWNGLRYFPRQAKGKSFDIVFVFSLSPITAAIPAIYLKWRLRKPMAMWVLDLWPESLSATGFIKNKFVLSAIGLMVRGIYACSGLIMVQSRAFITAVSRYANPAKLVYYPNCSRDTPSTLSADTQVPRALLDELDSRFCIVFAGNLGTAQAVETLAEAAERLKHLTDVRIVLVGSGSMSPWLAEQKQSRNLDNLILAGRYPSSEMPQFLTRAQGLIVSLKRSEIYAQTVPAKIQSYLSAGRPILASIDGEGARVVEEAGAGLVSPAEDAVQLARNIEQLHGMSAQARAAMGERGRAYFLEHFELEKQAARLAELLQQHIDRGGR